jgi:hypothetical protein
LEHLQNERLNWITDVLDDMMVGSLELFEELVEMKQVHVDEMMVFVSLVESLYRVEML